MSKLPPFDVQVLYGLDDSWVVVAKISNDHLNRHQYYSGIFTEEDYDGWGYPTGYSVKRYYFESEKDAHDYMGFLKHTLK